MGEANSSQVKPVNTIIRKNEEIGSNFEKYFVQQNKKRYQIISLVYDQKIVGHLMVFG